jgi:serine protease Do
VRPLTPDEQREADIKGGLVVEQVTGGPAAAAGIRPGDIILRVGDEPVRSVEDLRKATDTSSSSVALLIQRQDAQIYVPLRLG